MSRVRLPGQGEQQQDQEQQNQQEEEGEEEGLGQEGQAGSVIRVRLLPRQDREEVWLFLFFLLNGTFCRS